MSFIIKKENTYQKWKFLIDSISGPLQIFYLLQAVKEKQQFQKILKKIR